MGCCQKADTNLPSCRQASIQEGFAMLTWGPVFLVFWGGILIPPYLTGIALGTVYKHVPITRKPMRLIGKIGDKVLDTTGKWVNEWTCGVPM